MDDDIAQSAVSEALKGNWPKAVELNQQILKKERKNIDALNRLARAYAELGEIEKARQTSKKSLQYDPLNKIAERCLEKWKGLKKDKAHSFCPGNISCFIEEPGKTQITHLVNLCSKDLIARLYTGDEVIINPQGQRLSILTPEGKYIGRLPDLVGARLKRLIKAGNCYSAVIKAIEPQSMEIFIRETKHLA